MRRATLAAACATALLAAAPAFAQAPEPGSPEYFQRDLKNMQDANGRVHGEGGQLDNPAYLPALVAESTDQGLGQLVDQARNPNRPVVTAGQWFPGWNVGNPLRAGWEGRRGQRTKVAWTNRYGALIRGDVWAPLEGARDPYTGARLKPPYPGVVITTGSIQGSERMYWWLAQDLAERGYVVLTYDVQGQGTSETFPHEGPVNDLPFCNPFAEPKDEEQYGCPGVPFQQMSNFTHGTRDALSFMLSTPAEPYPNPARGSAQTDDFNPFWRVLDHRRDRRTVTPGRTTKIAVIGHSLGAAAVSRLQATDARIQTIVALDKLGSGTGGSADEIKPVVPALGVQSEYGFTVQPYWANHGSSITPRPDSPDKAPDPRRELATGFDAWRKAKVDTMVIVPRGSTHLDYTDIPLAMPASRYGQDLTSVYVQAWLDKYLKHRKAAQKRLLATRWAYLEPVGNRRWESVELARADLLSFYYCSGYAIRSVRKPRRILVDADVAGVGCPKR